ncbi:hypothetical protein K227x_06760 [Rubripirellula lacrimiformis]|uniref:Secreted protein n=1 Tax=Rubripirellula lacrimiformis TaxID=1930273 RepID=A0A517N584_9BACT|nr:hypothetical protein [Rubripirellula lacrimiformis]QDT02300.1 hypothetical protein K227x_06760 [Rubripirellula lacrimiformis]
MKIATLSFVFLCVFAPLAMTSGCSGGTEPVVIEGGEEMMTDAEEEAYEAEVTSSAEDESQN